MGMMEARSVDVENTRTHTHGKNVEKKGLVQ